MTAIAIIPSAPVLVPELAGSATAELTDLRAALCAAAAALPQRWLAIGVDAVARRVGPDSAGTFAGYGADLRVALSPGAHPASDLPLCALIAAWLRGLVAPDARAETYCYPTSLDNKAAVGHGRALHEELNGATEPLGVLVVADGCRTLLPAAPGGYDPASLAVQSALDDALAAGDTAALARLPDDVVGRAAFGVLAGLAGDGPRSTRELYRGAPYGVGYFVGVWQT
jgi:hypothetical protein